MRQDDYKARFALEAIRDQLEAKEWPSEPLFASELLIIVEVLFGILDEVAALRTHWHAENYLGDREVQM